MQNQAYLVYIGNGASLPSIPARDLTKEEADQFGEMKLLNSGLYMRPAAKPSPKSNKVETGGFENKEKE